MRCRGHRVVYADCYEYECEYEYSGDIDCGDCLFGSWGGTLDPRVNPYSEEDDEE